MSKLQIQAINVLLKRKGPLCYEDLGEMIGAHPRGVGRIVSTLAGRGFAKLCRLVVYKKDLQ